MNRSSGPHDVSAIRRLEIVGELASLINSTFDLDRIFRAAILKLKQIIPFRRASVTLVAEDRSTYSLHTLYDTMMGGFTHEEGVFPINQGFTGEAIRTGRAVRVEGFRGTDGIRMPGEQDVSLLVIPLGVDGQIMATLNLGAMESQSWTDDDLQLAVLLGRQLETSLHYSRLLATIASQRDHLARNGEQMRELYDKAQERCTRITELEQLRDSLVHMVAHDLRSLLQAIQGDLSILDLANVVNGDEDARDALSNATRNVRKVNAMIDSMLEVSRLESSSMPLRSRQTEMQEIVEGAVAGLGCAAERVRVDREPSADPSIAVCDPDLVQRVVTNFLDNAIDHSPPDAPVVVSLARNNGNVRVSVIDRGPGVPPEARTQIFEKFCQVGRKGRKRKASVGLGLAFCKLAVEAHGGTIGLDSTEGEGATFWFELPTAPALRGCVT